MTGERAGFLMTGTWAAEVVLAHKLELRGGPPAAGRARARLTELLEARIAEDDLHDVVVLASELVTNAVRHGGADEHETVVVHVAIAADVLRLEVCDQGPGFTPPSSPRSRAADGGHGLMLVERMSSSWGVAGDDGTCVWFERALVPR